MLQPSSTYIPQAHVTTFIQPPPAQPSQRYLEGTRVLYTPWEGPNEGLSNEYKSRQQQVEPSRGEYQPRQTQLHQQQGASSHFGETLDQIHPQLQFATNDGR